MSVKYVYYGIYDENIYIVTHMGDGIFKYETKDLVNTIWTNPSDLDMEKIGEFE